MMQYAYVEATVSLVEDAKKTVVKEVCFFEAC